MKITQKDYDSSSNKMKRPGIQEIMKLTYEVRYWKKRYLMADKRANKWKKFFRSADRSTKLYMDINRSNVAEGLCEINKWRKEARYFERWYENMKYFNDEQRKDWFKTIDKLETANLKQKKAWIAFCIATILYIVGILILI